MCSIEYQWIATFASQSRRQLPDMQFLLRYCVLHHGNHGVQTYVDTCNQRVRDEKHPSCGRSPQILHWCLES